MYMDMYMHMYMHIDMYVHMYMYMGTCARTCHAHAHARAQAKRAGPFQPLLQMLLSMGLRTEAARGICGDATLEGPYRRRLSKLLKQAAVSRRQRALSRANPAAFVPYTQ